MIDIEWMTEIEVKNEAKKVRQEAEIGEEK